MKQSHIRTPRNLAECSFDVGYPIQRLTPDSNAEQIGGYLLAVAIGAGLACLLVTWWSS